MHADYTYMRGRAPTNNKLTQISRINGGSLPRRGCMSQSVRGQVVYRRALSKKLVFYDVVVEATEVHCELVLKVGVQQQACFSSRSHTFQSRRLGRWNQT